MKRAAIGPLLALVAFAACEEERSPLGVPVCTTWRGQVREVLARECGTCHGDALAEGRYSVASYLEAIGAGSDEVANAIAGDSDSLILRVMDPRIADARHADFGEVRSMLEGWVVDCRLSYSSPSVHEGGILNPEDPSFHGKLVRDVGYNLEACTGCHGSDFRGGAAEASCVSCHPSGPADCKTCHGDLLDLGRHRTHVVGAGLQKIVACQSCHEVPSELRAPGHVLVADGTLDPAPPEVRFSGLAAQASGAGFDPESQTCATYCHGASRPRWDEPEPRACGDCHGDPPESHASARCGNCHPRVADDARTVVDTSLHLDGELSVGEGGGGCGSCHGDVMGLPPPALDGATSRWTASVGAHRVHADGPSGLSGEIGCEACHVLPAALLDVGHIDSDLPAEVFEGASFSSLATADGATPLWSPATASCSGAYCHGGGQRLGADASPGIRRTLRWDDPRESMACGDCHGVPPATGDHASSMDLSSCASCHGRSVDGFGRIIVELRDSRRASSHLNGVVDGN